MMRTLEELERELAAVEDAVLRTDHTDKDFMVQYTWLYDLRLALLWALGRSPDAPSGNTLVRAARAGKFWKKP